MVLLLLQPQQHKYKQKTIQTLLTQLLCIKFRVKSIICAKWCAKDCSVERRGGWTILFAPTSLCACGVSSWSMISWNHKWRRWVSVHATQSVHGMLNYCLRRGHTIAILHAFAHHWFIMLRDLYIYVCAIRVNRLWLTVLHLHTSQNEPPPREGVRFHFNDIIIFGV